MPKGDRGPRSGGGQQSRPVMISKALSRLLRHQAQADKIPISPQGWVRVDHATAWHGLSSKNRFGDQLVRLEEVFQVVENNEKKRFAMKYYKSKTADPRTSGEDVGKLQENIADMQIVEQGETETADLSTTAEALSIFESGTDTEPSHFFIRAVQGHSIKTVETEGLLTPITLDNPASIPDTVVHGTFHGAWDSILKDGGLKKMSRNMVHFATGPSLQEVIPQEQRVDEGHVEEALGKNKVISGMRSDAQILIYIDIRRCLEDVKANNLDMTWFRSENGVILTEGIAIDSEENEPALGEDVGPEVETREATRKENWKKSTPVPKHLVPTKYWNMVVEVKTGQGLLWKQGQGVVKDLPDALRRKAVPHGKGRAPRGGGKGRGRG